MKTYKSNPILLASLMCVMAAGPAKADDAPAKSFQDSAELTLEQLVNIQVTSVSKKETELSLSPAAISVVTEEDIRRLGITTIPEALRLVPGMDVARVNGNEWAVGARGFNDEFANKLLVLIDGRTVYTPASGGVFWNAQDVVMEDLARIEVIRGPGATLWGANAVNGVVNIISKPAKETQGALVSTAVGTEDQPTTTARYGGQIGTNLYYRVYAKYFNRDGLVDSAGQDASDDWRMAHGGFRLDWEQSAENLLTLQGDGYGGHAEKTVSSVSLSPAATQLTTGQEQNDGANVLGRWTHTFSEASQLSLQGYYDYFKEDDGNGTEYSHTLDFDLQHHFALGTRNDIVWGAGYRHASIQNTSDFNLTWTPETQQIQLYNVFAQDDITLVRERLHLTLGSKFEHNNLVGLEIQPSGRLLWTPTAHQTVWAGVSRAARTPSLFEQNARLNVAAFQPPGSPPVLVSILGNPAVTAEKVTAYELGYRIEPTPRLSFDLAGYYNQYSDLLVQASNPFQFEAAPAPPHGLISSTYQNADSGETYGTELSAQWQVTDHWRIMGSYTWLRMQLHPDASVVSESPQQQFQLRSYLDLSRNWELNGAVYYVNQIETPSGANEVTIPSYIRLDLGVVWRPIKSIEVGIWGQNLLDNQHPESGSDNSTLVTEIPRGVVGKVTWRF